MADHSDFSEAEGSEDDFPEGGGGSGKRKLFLIIPVVLLLVGGAVGGWAYFTGRLQPILDKFHASQEAKVSPAQEPVYYDVPDILVDLRQAGRRGTYLKLRASLLLQDKNDYAFVDSQLPIITDCFEVNLRDLRVEDLPRPGGMEGVRAELRMSLNQRLKRDVIRDVLLKEILVGTTG